MRDRKQQWNIQRDNAVVACLAPDFATDAAKRIIAYCHIRLCGSNTNVQASATLGFGREAIRGQDTG